jgi:protein-tyrosine phosphatase
VSTLPHFRPGASPRELHRLPMPMPLLQRLAHLLPWAARPTRVLIVCSATPCRSPLVEATARGRTDALARMHPGVKKLNLRFASARVRPTPQAVDPAAAQCLRQRGYRTSLSRLRNVTPESIARSQIVLATDRTTLRSLQRRCTSPHAHKLHLMLDFVPGLAGQDLLHPQPGAKAEFSRLVDLCELAVNGLTHSLVAGAPANVGFGKRSETSQLT